MEVQTLSWIETVTVVNTKLVVQLELELDPGEVGQVGVDAVRPLDAQRVGVLVHGGDHAVIHPSAGRQTIEVWREWLTEVKARDITVLDIKVSTQVAVEPIRHVFVAILGLLSIFIILKGPGTHYRRRMRLEELMREQAKSFPAIVPFLKFNPRDMPSRAPGAPVPVQLPLFAEALSPEEWLAYHEVTYIGGQIDINRAWQALAQQLGRRWQGPLALPLHTQALFAVFALKAARKRKAPATIIAAATGWRTEEKETGGGEISSTSASGSPETAAARQNSQEDGA